AHRHNPPDLFRLYSKSTLIVGAVRVASSKVETVDDIARRLAEVAQHIDLDRLIVAPDCGLGFLGRDLAMQKLQNLREAADRV
ncbi:MAG: hypothetical protein OXQ92_04925, partial [Boseongicola sp.]|nr:hypothetical protein [Boseongicola sp.]